MAELNMDGGSIFVDVNTGQQYPILYTQLLTNGEEGNATEQPHEQNVKKEIVAAALENQEAQEIMDVSEGTETIPKHERSATPPAAKVQNLRIRCPECQRFTTETEEKMLRHIRRVHRGENPYQCSMCDYSTYNSAVFEEHVNVHQGIKPFKCAHCHYRSASKKNTKKHELIHRPDNPLKCTHCDFIGRNPRVLSAHNRKIHNNSSIKMYECDLCKKYFDDRELYKKHRHSRFQCKLCNFASCKQSLITLHKHEEHENEEEPKLSKQKSRLITTNPFKCFTCAWSSNNKPRILLHLIHHPKQTVDESIVDVSILKKLGIME